MESDSSLSHWVVFIVIAISFFSTVALIAAVIRSGQISKDKK